MKGKNHTMVSKQKNRLVHKGKHYSPRTEFKVGHSYGCRFKKSHISWNKGLTKETDERVRKCTESLSVTLTGKKQSKEMIEKRINPLRGRSHSREHTRNILRGLFSGPTNPEVELGILLEEILPGEYIYTGHGEVIIGGLCPDFFNINGQKKIIEMFGEVFHDPSRSYVDKIGWRSQEWGRGAVFGQFGYDTLVVWSEELTDKSVLKTRIMDFHKRKDIGELE